MSPLVLDHRITKSSRTRLDLVNYRLNFGQHRLFRLHMYTCSSTLPTSSSLYICPSPHPVHRQELAWPSPLPLTVSMLNTSTSQDQRHVAHTTAHAMVSLNMKPKLDHFLTINHYFHTWAHIHHVFAVAMYTINCFYFHSFSWHICIEEPTRQFFNEGMTSQWSYLSY